MKLTGKDKVQCCGDPKVYKVKFNAPRIRKAKSDADGFVTVTFD
jgi:hypothetical protein